MGPQTTARDRPLPNSSKQPTRPIAPTVHVFPAIGIVPVMIAIGYGSCMALFGGAATIVMLNLEKFFSVSGDKVLYLSDGIRAHMAVSIMCFGTSYAFLWGIVMILSWILGHVILFLLACVNLFCFNGVLAYIELDGPEHVAFVIALLTTHALMHHLTANSNLGFLWYQRLVNFSFGLLALFILFWLLGESVVKRNEVKLAAFIFELLLWICASVEFALLVSMLQTAHNSQFTQMYDVSDPGRNLTDLVSLYHKGVLAPDASGAADRSAGNASLEKVVLAKQPTSNAPDEPPDQSKTRLTNVGSLLNSSSSVPAQAPFLNTRVTMRTTPAKPDSMAAWSTAWKPPSAAPLPAPPRNARASFFTPQ